jgi:hypothetical protein
MSFIFFMVKSYKYFFDHEGHEDRKGRFSPRAAGRRGGQPSGRAIHDPKEMNRMKMTRTPLYECYHNSNPHIENYLTLLFAVSAMNMVDISPRLIQQFPVGNR